MLAFSLAGWLNGFAYKLPVSYLFLFTPPFFFALTWVFLVIIFLGKSHLHFLDLGAMFAGFYIGFFTSVFLHESGKHFEPLLADNLINSVLGGGISQLVIWRDGKAIYWLWKFPLIICGTILAGWIFNQIWIGNFIGPAHHLHYYEPRFYDAFGAWYAIVGTITFVVFYFTKSGQKEAMSEIITHI